ncbi:serine/threonine-protein kinase [Megavirus baoshan]|uniref:Serine/threonine-protein kinase n=1 Tax=Megavirus baoshan TaxID=2496520 RepID=A0A3Q8U8W5_9VIRU|nr:serine/threonine-protein kinase [Megavirus baoshan]AZL89911.1 serine/threonine-protein kinase [Megavirus baoshan]
MDNGFNKMDLFNHHVFFTEKYRIPILDWMFQLTIVNKMTYDTFQLSVTLLDQYLLNKSITIETHDIGKFAIVCITIASKINDVNPIDIEYASKIYQDKYNAYDLCGIEIDILDKLNYCVMKSIFWACIKNYMVKNNIDINIYNIAHYLSHVVIYKPDYLLIPTNILADKIILLSEIIYNHVDNIINIITEDIVCAHIYQQYILNITNHETSYANNFFDKTNVRNLIQEQIIKIKKVTCANNLISDKYRYQLHIFNQYHKYSHEEITNRNVIKTIGKGNYGIVYECKLLDQVVALKACNNHTFFDDGINKTIISEINCLSILDHKNIIKMYGYYYDIKNDFMFISLEIASGPLSNFINDIPDTIKFSYIHQIIEGVKYMHKNGIMHRDLTIQNILVGVNGCIKICDFGMSRQFVDIDVTGNYNYNVCSLESRALELLLENESYNSKVDVWACACIMYHILFGNNLFLGITEYTMLNSIFKIFGTPSENYYPEICKQVVFKKYFEEDYITYTGSGMCELRLKYTDIYDIIKNMFTYDIHKRLNIFEVSDLLNKTQYFKNII